MRTLKEIRSFYSSILELKKDDETQTAGLQIKSADEKRFADKHVIKKVADRNGNGDDVFNATNIKSVDRQPKHGYNPGEDEKVYEEVELDEGDVVQFEEAAQLDPDKKAKKAIDTILKNHEEPADEKGMPFEGPYTKVPEKQAKQKSDPLMSRARHLARQAIVAKEDLEITEVLKPSMGVKAYIDDFVKSDDPRFKGASKKDRIKRALAAYYSAKRGD